MRNGERPPALDLSIPDSELAPDQLSRRGMLRRVGMLGAGVSVMNVLAASAARADE
jgi:hypothetical protein